MLNIDATPRLTSPRGGRCKGCGSNSRLQGAAGYHSLSFPQGRIILFSSGLCRLTATAAAATAPYIFHSWSWEIFSTISTDRHTTLPIYPAQWRRVVSTAEASLMCAFLSDGGGGLCLRTDVGCGDGIIHQQSEWSDTILVVVVGGCSCWEGLNCTLHSLTWGQLRVSSVQTCKVIFRQSEVKSPIFLCFRATPGGFLPTQTGVPTLSQFDVIQLNSSPLYSASGLFSLCGSNKCSAVEFGSCEKWISASHGKKSESLMICSLWRRPARLWCSALLLNLPLYLLCNVHTCSCNVPDFLQQLRTGREAVPFLWCLQAHGGILCSIPNG